MNVDILNPVQVLAVWGIMFGGFFLLTWGGPCLVKWCERLQLAYQRFYYVKYAYYSNQRVCYYINEWREDGQIWPVMARATDINEALAGEAVPLGLASPVPWSVVQAMRYLSELPGEPD